MVKEATAVVEIQQKMQKQQKGVLKTLAEEAEMEEAKDQDMEKRINSNNLPEDCHRKYLKSSHHIWHRNMEMTCNCTQIMLSSRCTGPRETEDSL